MLKHAALWGVTIGLCLGGCTITINPGGDGTSGDRIYLDQTDASIDITQAVGAAHAEVSATVTDNWGRAIHFASDQAVEINGVALAGPNSRDEFTAEVHAASEYVVTVDEPSRGVEHTTVPAPADFEITSPAEGGGASLSGFTLTWSGADERFQVRIKLSQTLFGTTKVINLGPFTDTGSRQIGANDLKSFGQGEDLIIDVTKINTVNNVAGFNSGTATMSVTASVTASPGP